MITTVLPRVARIKKNVSRTERGTFFMSVVLLVSSSTGTQMSVSSALWCANIGSLFQSITNSQNDFFYWICNFK